MSTTTPSEDQLPTMTSQTVALLDEMDSLLSTVKKPVIPHDRASKIAAFKKQTGAHSA
ncbi:hypothetical protein NX059_000877 [Plenodomus lindquistii]|nr:hypothetical protein NX059_000877 [Plenodomus lindquistii]